MGKQEKEDGEGGGGGHIRTYLRIRPSKRASGRFEQDEVDRQKLFFNIPVEKKDGEFVNNSKQRHAFKFDGILDDKATQEDVFEKIGKEAVLNVLDGYNSTIFAYGQTGSGKTFTITGGAERYVDRGIIPRALSMLFEEFKRRSSVQWTTHVSYLEIYQEKGYDLLDPSQETAKLEDLPKVSLMEDEGGNIHLKNLSMCVVPSEEEALNCLFLGDTNRAISETAMNKASSRSHCLFTISIEGRQAGSEVVTRSKLHLVDLAGSERVHKTMAEGQTLNEARYINTSLFYLEMVIVALHEKAVKGRVHVPYRNSMMTSVLRDSLGGNCKTVMVATINPEENHTEESISTSKFAQRVSLIKNDARVNEDLDPLMVIRRLKADCATLRAEVAFLKEGLKGEGEGGGGGEGELSEEERRHLEEACRLYVDSTDPEARMGVGEITLSRLKECFSVFKRLVLEARRGWGGGGKAVDGEGGGGATASGTGGGGGGEGGGGGGGEGQQVAALRSALRQRDDEIAILVNMVKQGKGVDMVRGSGHGSTSNSNSNSNSNGSSSSSSSSSNSSSGSNSNGNSGSGLGSREVGAAAAAAAAVGDTAAGAAQRKRLSSNAANAVANPGIAPPSDPALLMDRQRCFAYYRQQHSSHKALEDNKALLKAKYAEAKQAAESVEKARSSINFRKKTIEMIRRERAMDGLRDEEGGEGEGEGEGEGRGREETAEEQEERDHLAAIEKEKTVYKASFASLRGLKAEIEHIQRLLEKGIGRVEKDFSKWYEDQQLVIQQQQQQQQESRGGQQSQGGAQAQVQRKSAWGTPPGSRVVEGEAFPNGGGQAQAQAIQTLAPAAEGGSMATQRQQQLVIQQQGRGEAGGEKLPSLTGNREADDDIAAFYRAKTELQRRRGGGQGQ